jgi:isopropylmalate/homocitrate/citramalate synthase
MFHLMMYGIDVGINFSKLNELSKLVMDLAGVPVPLNRPFVGDKAYSIEPGIVTNWYRNVFEENPTVVFPVHPRFVGDELPKIVMGKKSGVDNVSIWAENLGIEMSEEKKMEVLTKVKRFSHDSKRNLTEQEFSKIAKQVIESISPLQAAGYLNGSAALSSSQATRI